MRPTCHGNERFAVHVKACRKSRPLCRWRRREIGVVCGCDAYHFPHRRGSGCCGNLERRWARDFGMSVEDVREANARARKVGL